jgi:hypothetical protein
MLLSVWWGIRFLKDWVLCVGLKNKKQINREHILGGLELINSP